MILVSASKNLTVELRPYLVIRVSRFCGKGMAGGAERHQGFGRVQMVANGRHHLAWWRPASRAENDQIGSFDRLPITELIVRWIRAGGDEGTIEPTPGQVVVREFGQGFPRMIIVLTHHE